MTRKQKIISIIYSIHLLLAINTGANFMCWTLKDTINNYSILK